MGLAPGLGKSVEPRVVAGDEVAPLQDLQRLVGRQGVQRKHRHAQGGQAAGLQDAAAHGRMRGGVAGNRPAIAARVE